jgi:hypothetical protein
LYRDNTFHPNNYIDGITNSAFSVLSNIIDMSLDSRIEAPEIYLIYILLNSAKTYLIKLESGPDSTLLFKSDPILNVDVITQTLLDVKGLSIQNITLATQNVNLAKQNADLESLATENDWIDKKKHHVGKPNYYIGTSKFKFIN